MPTYEPYFNIFDTTIQPSLDRNLQESQSQI